MIGALFLIIGAPICGHAAPDCKWWLAVPNARASVSDRAEWLINVLTHRSPNFGRSERLAEIILEKSPREQNKWIEAIANAYPRLAIDRPGPPGYFIGSKRITDRLLFWIQGLNVKYEELTKTMDNKSAFIKTMADQTRLFHTMCTEEDILAVADRFQGLVKKWNNAHPNEAGLSLTIGGSFINGKWRPGSDVDISISKPSEFEALKPTFAELLAGLSPGCSPYVTGSAEHYSFWGGMNPFALEINANSYRLYVFKPTNSHEQTHLSPSSYQTFDW